MGKKSRTKKKKQLNEAIDKDKVHNAQEFKDEVNLMIQNGLQSALLPTNQFGTEQLSQTETVEKSLRYWLVSNMRQMLSQMYCEIGLVQTMIDLPVEDAFRGGLEIKSQQLSEDDLMMLARAMEENEDIENLKEALQWMRLFGGGGLIINTDQEADKPFDPLSISKDDRLSFKPVDMWELYGDTLNVDDEENAIGLKKLRDTDITFNFYSQTINRTRVMKFKGKRAPSFVRPRLRGWGLSVVEVFIRSVNQFLKSNNLTFEILDEAKIDVYKIKGLATALMNNQEDKIRKRVAIANSEKNYRNAVSLDTEDDYQQKQLALSGLADLYREFRIQIASDLRMPITKLFGISSSGFNSGEDDIENYNAMVESTIRTPARPKIREILKLRCLQLFGFIPSDLDFEFKSLRIMSTEQEENAKSQVFNRLIQAKQAGEITNEEFIESCNKAGLFPNKVKGTGEDINFDEEIDDDQEQDT